MLQGLYSIQVRMSPTTKAIFTTKSLRSGWNYGLTRRKNFATSLAGSAAVFWSPTTWTGVAS